MHVRAAVPEGLREDPLGQPHHRAVVERPEVVQLGVGRVRRDGLDQLGRATLEAVRGADGAGEHGGRADHCTDAAAAGREAHVVQGHDVGRVGAGDDEGPVVAPEWQDAVALGDRRGDERGDGVVDLQRTVLEVLETQLVRQRPGDCLLGDEAQPDDGLPQPFAPSVRGELVLEGVGELALVEDALVEEQLAEPSPQGLARVGRAARPRGRGRAVVRGGAGVGGHQRLASSCMRPDLTGLPNSRQSLRDRHGRPRRGTASARSGRPRVGGRAVGILTAALLLSGCRVTVDVAVDVEADGSGVLQVTTAADDAAREAASSDDGPDPAAGPLDGVAALGESLAAEGWRTADTVDAAGTRAVALAVDFADPAALERLSGELADALAATEARPLEPLRLQVTEDRVLLSGSAAIEPTAAVADAGYTPEQVVALLEERGALGYTVRATFPGEVVRADGARVDGMTAVWQVAPGTRVDIAAEAVRPQPVWPWVVAGVGATLLLLAAGVLARRRRRRSAAATAATGRGAVGGDSGDGGDGGNGADGGDEPARRRRSSRPREDADRP